jgi:ABC-type transport system involved in cytochrome bd biosynthesis fused ATPase/permease subunit
MNYQDRMLALRVYRIYVDVLSLPSPPRKAMALWDTTMELLRTWILSILILTLFVTLTISLFCLIYMYVQNSARLISGGIK